MGEVRCYLCFLGVATVGLALDLWSKSWAFHSLRQGGRRVVIPHVLELQTMLNPGALFGLGSGQTLLFLVASAFALVLVFWMYSQTTTRQRMLHVALGAILAGALGNMYDRVLVRLVDAPLPDGPRRVYTVRLGEDPHGTILREYPPDIDGAEYRLRAETNPERGVVIVPHPPRPRGVRVHLETLPREAGFVRDFLKIPTTLPRWSWLPASVRGKELWPWVFNVADALLVGGVALLALHLLRGRRRARCREPRLARSDAGA